MTLDEETDKLRGSRSRKEIDYSDGLTEKQWLRAIDAEDEDGDGSRGSTPPPSSRKRGGRKRRKKDGDEEDDAVDDKPKKRRGRPPVEKMSPITPRLTRCMKKLLDIVVGYEDR